MERSETTRPKETSATLETAKDRFQGIINAIADAVVVVDTGGVVRFANPAAEELFGRAGNELVDEVFGFPLAAGDDTEVDVHHRRGDHRVAEMRVVESEWQGEPVLLASLRDITDRKRLEELRAEQAETRAQRQEAELATRRMQLLADAGAMLASSLSLVGPMERFVRLLVPRLADWCLLVLASDAVTTGHRSAFFAHADPEAEASLEALIPAYRCLPDSEIFSSEAELVSEGAPWLERLSENTRRGFDTPGLVSAIHLPVFVNDEMVGCMTLARSGRELPPSALSGKRYDKPDLALARELGRRIGLALENARLYRQAEQASRMRDEFMAKVSHEMRTPLQAILGWTSILQANEAPGDEGSGRWQRGLEVIERNARSQVHLIEDILDVSRIITGKLSLERESMNLETVIHSALESLVPAAEEKGIDLQAPDPGSGPHVVHGDPHRLRQVVTNLVSNAIKYTPEQGRVRVALKAVEEVNGDGGAVELRVEDNGKGISKDALPHIFDQFRQGGSEDGERGSGSGDGLGLGLAIVHQLVEMHGGEVRADSEGTGQGTTIRVRLPLTDADGKTRTAKPLLDAEEVGRGVHHDLSDLRLAVVDDEPDARELVETALTDLGARVWTAANTGEFFDRLDRDTASGRLPDVVISDIGMPETDGYALLRKLRQRPAEEGGGIPAVALTGYSRPEDAGRAKDAGFERHLAKPVSLAHLANVIAELAGGEGSLRSSGREEG